MELLEPVDEHGSIDLVTKVRSKLHDEIGPDSQEVFVKGRVVEFAQCQAVRDQGLTHWIAVGDDVRGIQKFDMSKAANCAAGLISSKDALTEAHLMEACEGDYGQVSPAPLRGDRVERSCKNSTVVNGDNEPECLRIVALHKDRIDWQIPAGQDAVEIDQWCLVSPGFPQSNVVTMIRVRPTISIVEEIAFHPVFVGCRSAGFGRGGADADRNPLESGRLEDSLLWTHQADSLAIALKASDQQFARKDLTMQLNLLVEELESSLSDARIPIHETSWFEKRSSAASSAGASRA